MLVLSLALILALSLALFLTLSFVDPLRGVDGEDGIVVLWK